MTRSIADAVAELKASICQTLDPDEIQRACIEVGHIWRDRLFDPVTTIWLFTLQIVHCNTACTHVVRLLPGFPGTDSGYCQARSRIPRAVFRRLFELATQRLLEAIDRALDRWHGHRVFFVDGSSCSMPDTPELQSAFGQPTGQQPGCGFPIANIVGLFHRSGLLVEMLVNPLYTHEARVAHQLLGHLRRGDLLVGDRAFASYVILAMLVDRGAHAVMREHQRRATDFRFGRRIARNDRIIERARPLKCPRWLDAAEFERLPDRLRLRQVRYSITQNGYRTQKVVLVTTLLDSVEYSVDELAALYGERWEAETCFRHLKQTLRMDVLRCKTADGVRKELWLYGITYNLVRTIMVQAGLQQGVPPDRISLIDVVRCLALGQIDIDSLPRFVVRAYRPGRHQPRAVKRRPKQYARLNHPRPQMRKAMAAWTL